MNGNNIIIYTFSGSAWVAIASTKSDEVQGDCDMLEKASSTQQDWKEFDPGRKSWSLNISWLVTAVSDINKVLLLGTKVKIHIDGRGYTGGATGLTGFALVKNCKMTLTWGNLAQGSLVLQGTGELAVPSNT
jgi:hypothetical protein